MPTTATGTRDGDRERLRAKGLRDALDQSGRATSEGAVGVARSGERHAAAFVELRCETDFVQLLAQTFLVAPERGSIADVIAWAQSKDGFGENVVLTRFGRWQV